jgi:hypothetical protein
VKRSKRKTVIIIRREDGKTEERKRMNGIRSEGRRR